MDPSDYTTTATALHGQPTAAVASTVDPRPDHLLPLGAPFNCRLPLEPHPIVGLHVVLPLLFHIPLPPCLPLPIPPPPPPPPSSSPRPPPRPPQPRLVPPLRHNLRRHIPLRRGRDPRHPVVLAPHEDSLGVATLFPTGHSPLRPGVLLVLPLLSLPLPPYAHHHSRNLKTSQVLAILFATLVYSLVYGYKFWTAIGFRGACFPFVLNCQIALLGCNVACHVGVFLLHFFFKGGCNGIGAWVFNSVLNGAVLLLFLNFYVRVYVFGKRERKIIHGDCDRDPREAESKARSSCPVLISGN
ncbi:Elongation of fatty acids protein 3-like [Arachis hypogaea]|nr:Elongation of fatty acids protein 3-like [Arachis hypogaea]